MSLKRGRRVTRGRGGGRNPGSKRKKHSPKKKNTYQWEKWNVFVKGKQAAQRAQREEEIKGN